MNLVSAHVNQILRKIHIITMNMCVQINKYKKKQRPHVWGHEVLSYDAFNKKNWNTLKLQ